MSCCFGGVQYLLRLDKKDRDERNSKLKPETELISVLTSVSGSECRAHQDPRDLGDIRGSPRKRNGSSPSSTARAQQDEEAGPVLAKLLIQNANLQAEADVAKDVAMHQLKEYIREAQEAVTSENQKLCSKLQSENMQLRADLIRAQEQLSSLQSALLSPSATSGAHSNLVHSTAAIENKRPSAKPARAKDALLAGLRNGTVSEIMQASEAQASPINCSTVSGFPNGTASGVVVPSREHASRANSNVGMQDKGAASTLAHAKDAPLAGLRNGTEGKIVETSATQAKFVNFSAALEDNTSKLNSARAKDALLAGLRNGTVNKIFALMEEKPPCTTAKYETTKDASNTNGLRFELANNVHANGGAKCTSTTQVYKNVRSSSSTNVAAKVAAKETLKERPSRERAFKNTVFREPRPGSAPSMEQRNLYKSNVSSTLQSTNRQGAIARISNCVGRNQRCKPDVMSALQVSIDSVAVAKELPISSEDQAVLSNDEGGRSVNHCVLKGSAAGARAVAQERELRRIGSAPSFELPAPGGSCSSSGRSSASRRKPVRRTSHSPEPKKVPTELASSVLGQRRAMEITSNHTQEVSRKIITSSKPPVQRSRSSERVVRRVVTVPTGQGQSNESPPSPIGQQIRNCASSAINAVHRASAFAKEGNTGLAPQALFDSSLGSLSYFDRTQQQSGEAQLSFLETVQVTASKALGERLGESEVQRAGSKWKLPQNGEGQDDIEPCAQRSLAPSSRIPLDDIRSVRQAHGYQTTVRAVKRGPLLPQPVRGPKLSPSASEPIFVGVVSRNASTLVPDVDVSASSISLTEEAPSTISESPLTAKSGGSRTRVNSQEKSGAAAAKASCKVKRNDSSERRHGKSLGIHRLPPTTPLKSDPSQAIRTSPAPAGPGDPTQAVGTDPERGVVEYLRFGGWQEMWPGGELPRSAIRPLVHHRSNT